MKNLHAETSLLSVNRILSLLDRSTYSKTFGCFDRNFWHYKTLIDFSGSTYQQGCLYLAHLYSSKFEGNKYYKNKDILKYALASIDYWVSLQHKDGSFDEWYPNEHSHVATAFTLYGITESILLLFEELEDNKKLSYKITINKAVEWLYKNPDREVINHTTGALAAIYNAYLITGNKNFLSYCKKTIDIIKENQSTEGWFKEYGSADIGYTSVSLDYLAKYYSKSKDCKVEKIIEKALNFLTYFMHPDGTCGGEYGNRNTKYLMPAGLHLLSKDFDSAKYILNRYYQSLKKGNALSLKEIDDRYFIFFFAPNYIESAVIFESLSDKEFIYKKSSYNHFSQYFSESGILVRKTSSYYLVCNTHKGGVLKLFNNNGKLLYSDCGYFIKLDSAKIATSQSLNSLCECYVDNSSSNDLDISIKTDFKWVNQSLPLTKILIPFRIFNYTLGKSNFIMSIFNKYIKKYFIVKHKSLPIKLERSIRIHQNHLEINDILKTNKNMVVKSIDVPASSSALHVPSSKYAIDTDNISFRSFDLDVVSTLNTENSIQIKEVIEIM